MGVAAFRTSSRTLEIFVRKLVKQKKKLKKTEEKLALLKNNLHGDAKEWYRLQPTKTWAEISTSIVDRYGLTSNQKHAAKAKLFVAVQQPQETFSNCISRVQKLARDLTIEQDELVTISINGARPQIRAHLQMVSPVTATIAALLKLPIVSDDTLQHQLNPGYEVLVAAIASLNQQVASITTKLRDRSDSGAGPWRHDDTSPSERRRARQDTGATAVADVRTAVAHSETEGNGQGTIITGKTAGALSAAMSTGFINRENAVGAPPFVLGECSA